MEDDMIENKMALALKILNRVKRVLNRDHKTKTFSIGCYDNGREQGFAITNISDYAKTPNEIRKVIFSENRTSDQLVVYYQIEAFGEYVNHTMPTDKAYKNAKYYDPNEPALARAVEKIVNFIV